MSPLAARWEGVRGKLIVSCQAPEGDAFRGAGLMARFARAAVEGGAAAIRANGTADIAEIKASVRVPVIAIQKEKAPDGRILITPSYEAAERLAAAGADAIALDCTARGRRLGALERLQRIRKHLRLPVMADIATAEEGEAAAAAGADFVLTTLRGYTDDTAHIQGFDVQFVAELARRLAAPVIAEGNIRTPEEARAAIQAGAFAVVVGAAITRPVEITRRFARAVELAARTREARWLAGVDLGGTLTKVGVLSADGELSFSRTAPTPAGSGPQALIEHLRTCVTEALREASQRGLSVSAVGVATAGWVDPSTGRVVYATPNLPGWTGTEIVGPLQEVVRVPVFVENDANALAVGEKRFGQAREADNFAVITLGTGLGCGCYIGGKLHRGSSSLATALGHVVVEPQGIPCNCGKNGCLENYCNATALVRYAGNGAFDTAQQVITAANAGDQDAARAIELLGHYLARGCAVLVHLLDPELLIFAGGLCQDNHRLLANVERSLAGQIMAADRRSVRLHFSSLGYFGGVLGAGAAALERLEDAGKRRAL